MRSVKAYSSGLPKLLPILVGAALVAYFGFHAAYGERGLVSWRALEAEAAERQARLEALEARRQVVERRVALVSGPEIDGDILEEEVRAMFGWTRPDEIVILDSPTGNSRR